MPDNRRETGARSLQRKDRADANEDVSQKAAENRKPPGGVGNTEPSRDDNAKTRHFDGQQPPKGTA